MAGPPVQAEARVKERKGEEEQGVSVIDYPAEELEVEAQTSLEIAKRVKT